MSLEILAHRIQHFDKQRVSHRIEHLIAHFPGYHQFLEAQHREVLGKIGWFNLHTLQYRPDRQFPVGQCLNHVDARWVSKGLEDLCLKFPQSV